MSIVRDLLTGALRLLNVAAEGEALTAAQAADGLEALNALLESLNLDKLLVYSISRATYPLTVGQQTYTLGAGGNFNAPRPVRIENASILLNAGTLELPIAILQDEEWRDITVKGVTSSFPLQVYVTNDFPLNNLSFWPVPSAACSVVLYTWTTLSTFASVNDAVTLPPGYYRALRFLLARELAPEYGREASPTVQLTAEASKEWLRKQNWTPMTLSADAALLGGTYSPGRESRGYVVDP